MATLNRAKGTGQDLCAVVLEPGQFSWTITGIQRGEFGWNVTKKGRTVDKKAWQTAQYIARLAMVTPDFTDGSTHYHEANLHPAWAGQKRFVGQWGAHRFYRLTRDIEYIHVREAERETARFSIELVTWSCFPKGARRQWFRVDSRRNPARAWRTILLRKAQLRQSSKRNLPTRVWNDQLQNSNV